MAAGIRAASMRILITSNGIGSDFHFYVDKLCIKNCALQMMEFSLKMMNLMQMGRTPPLFEALGGE